eukprot:SAG31_NODE_12117_length_967_cov_0.862903_2_plen_113_part_00
MMTNMSTQQKGQLNEPLFGMTASPLNRTASNQRSNNGDSSAFGFLDVDEQRLFTTRYMIGALFGSDFNFGQDISSEISYYILSQIFNFGHLNNAARCRQHRRHPAAAKHLLR